MAGITLDISTANFLADEMVRSLDLARLDALLVSCGQDRESIVVSGTKNTMVMAVVQHCQLHQWLPALCQLVIASPGSYGASLVDACKLSLAQWQERLALIAPQAPNDRKSALLLFNGSPFADRAEQRKDVADLLNFLGRRVYVVRGEPATGKTQLAAFVRHLAEGRPGLRHVYLNLGEMSGDLIGPREVMSALARRMALETRDLSTDDMAQEVRLSEKLCDWFIGQTQAFAQQGVQWVVLIDSVNHPRVGPGAQDLIDRLMVCAARLDLVNTVLVVLAMDAAVPAAVAQDVKESRLPPITAADVRGFIEALARVMNKKLEAEALNLLEQQVLEGLAVPYGHDGMGRIGARLRALPELLA